MTALVINCVIGSGIFGIPSELTRLVGWLSPLAMVAGALVVDVGDAWSRGCALVLGEGHRIAPHRRAGRYG